MNQRPFISTQLNIFDENRCVFSPSMIGGQPVMISQEQNRKICDSMTTAIASNQPCNNSYYCSSPPACSNQPQIWPCPLQAQKQGVPGGVVFNFSQPNYCCPPSCLPSVYNPPPPPCPQIVDCSYKTPQTICVDFGKYGLEAMAFQQKCRQQCQGFTYDKQVGTGDQILFPKCNTCCCGVQCVTLNADQKEQLFHKIDETSTKSKLKICACDPIENRRCICFPKPNPDKFGSAKNLVIGERKERCCKDFDIVDQATREADAEAYLCCDCMDKWKKENEKRRPSCLKMKSECCDKQNEPKEVSFCFRGKTLEITETKEVKVKSVEQPTNTDHLTPQRASTSSETDNSDIVKYINELKKKRKGIVRMAQDFRETAKDYLEQLDRDIDNVRDLYRVANPAKMKKENFIKSYNLEHLFDNSEFEKTKDDEIDAELSSSLSKKFTAKRLRNSNKSQQTRCVSPKPNQQTNTEEVVKIIPSYSGEDDKISKTPDEVKHADATKSEIAALDSKNIGVKTDDSKSRITDSDQIDRTNTLEKKSGDERDNHLRINPMDLKSNEHEQEARSCQIEVCLVRKDQEPAESSEKASEHNKNSELETKGTLVPQISAKECVPDLQNLELGEGTSSETRNPENSDELTSRNTQLQTDTEFCKALTETLIKNVSFEEPSDESTGKLRDTNVLDIKSENTKNPEESSNDEKMKVNEKISNETPNSSERTFEQINEMSSLCEKNLEQPLDNISFSAQPSTSTNKKDGREMRRLETTKTQTNPDPTPKENASENTCRGNNNCRKIVKYISGTDEMKETEDIETETFCNCCRCYFGDEVNSENREDEVFKPCRGESGLISTVGQTVSNILNGTLERTGRIFNYLTNRRFQCAPVAQPFYDNPCIITNRYGCDSGCYDRRIRRYFSELDKPRNICQCRMDTNRFCGKTCYDNETNRWYSCCGGFSDEQKVVKITFKESAERRTIRLENNCRNSRYHVVYE